MATWPGISAPTTITDEIHRAQIKTNFSAGYTQSMPKWTRARKVFKLQWDCMTATDKQTLEAFFIANLGDTFTWTHPITNVTYTVRFEDDSISFEYVPINLWQVKVTLEEQ